MFVLIIFGAALFDFLFESFWKTEKDLWFKEAAVSSLVISLYAMTIGTCFRYLHYKCSPPEEDKCLFYLNLAITEGVSGFGSFVIGTFIDTLFEMMFSHKKLDSYDSLLYSGVFALSKTFFRISSTICVEKYLPCAKDKHRTYVPVSMNPVV